MLCSNISWRKKTNLIKTYKVKVFSFRLDTAKAWDQEEMLIYSKVLMKDLLMEPQGPKNGANWEELWGKYWNKTCKLTWGGRWPDQGVILHHGTPPSFQDTCFIITLVLCTRQKASFARRRIEIWSPKLILFKQLIEDFFHVYIASSKHKGKLGEFETVMQTRDAVEGLGLGYKWVVAKMLGVTLRWTNHSIQRGVEILLVPSCCRIQR